MSIISELFVRLSADNSSFKKSMKESEGDLLHFGDFAQEIGTKLAGYLAFAALADGAFKLAEAFEGASIIMQRSTGATGAALEGMNVSLEKVYASSAQSADTIAAVMSELSIRTGAQGTALERLTSATLDFAKVTGVDAKSAVTTNERLFASWTVATEAQGAAMDMLLVTHQRTGIAVDALSQTMISAGPVMRAYGFSFEETVALAGQFHKSGLDLDTTIRGLTSGFAAFAVAGKDPRDALLELVGRMKDAGNETAAFNMAIEAGFVKRGALALVDAVQKGAFGIAALKTELENSSGAVKKSAEDTVTLSEAWMKVFHQLNVNLAPAGKSILEFATKSAQGWALMLSDFKAKVAEIEGWIQKHPIGAMVLGVAMNPGQSIGGAGAGGAQEENFVFNPKSGGFESQTGPLKSPTPASLTTSQLGTGGGATGGGTPSTATDKFRPIIQESDSLAVLIEMEKTAQSEHAKTIGLIAESGFTIPAYFENLKYEAIQSAKAFDDLGNAVAPQKSTFDALAPSIDKCDKLLKELGADIAKSAQADLAKSTFGQLAAAADYFGITTADAYQKIADKSSEMYDEMQASGKATYRELAIAALKSAIDEINAARAKGNAVNETDAAALKADLAQWEGTSGKIIKSRYDLGRELEQMSHRTFDSLERGIADMVVTWSWSLDSLKKLGQNFAGDFLHIVLKGLLKPLEDAFAISMQKLGTMLANALGIGSGAASTAASTGTTVASGGATAAKAASTVGAGVAAGPIGIVTGIVSAVSNVISNFQQAKLETTMNAIEHNTRYSMMYLGDRSDGGILSAILRMSDQVSWGPGAKAMEAARDILVDIRDKIGGGTGGGSGGGSGITFNNCSFTGSPNQIADAIFTQASLAGAL